MEMRNRVILAVDVEPIDRAQTIIRTVGEHFGGIMIPPWNLFTKTLQIIREVGATIWFNPGSALPNHLKHELSGYLTFGYPEYQLDGLLMLCYPHLMEIVPGFIRDALEQYRRTWRPPFGDQVDKSIWPIPDTFAIASLTTEDPDARIQLRIDRARRASLAGVVVPCHMVEQTQQAGLKTMIIGIRDPNWPVPNDDQKIICELSKARQSQADIFVIGRPITGQPPNRQKEAAQYFVAALT